MGTLILIGLVSGIVTALSPCVLPILPIVLVSSSAPAKQRTRQFQPATGGAADESEPAPTPEPADSSLAKQARRRPFIVILGLVASFSILTLLGSAVLSLLGLPQDLLRWIGIAVLTIAGVGLLVPQVGDIVERPFARIPMRKLDNNASPFVVGLGLGLVFVPCAGPVLAAITVLSASGNIDIELVALTLAFAVGVAIPLLCFAVAGQRMGERIRAFRTKASLVRRVSGAVLIAMAIVLAFNLTASLQRLVPSYVAAAQDTLEGSDTAREALNSLSNAQHTETFDQCSEDSAHLHNCGRAPEIRGTQDWFNTPNGQALSLNSLKGKVVLVDFWTYSCINCQRTLPYLTRWDQTYRSRGLVTIGIHAPEFAFEKVPANVQSAINEFGIEYPVVQDNDFATWRAYGNQYWPAHYLIDRDGVVRQVHYGEGAYTETESLIRQLLNINGPAKSANNAAQDNHAGTPETYLGYARMQRSTNRDIVRDELHNYEGTRTPPLNSFSLSGDWSVGSQGTQAGSNAELALHYFASKAYVVIEGNGQVRLNVDGRYVRTISISGSPRLYEIASTAPGESTIVLEPTAGLTFYAFTFG